MPTYEFKCAKGHSFDRFLKLKDYDTPQVCECSAVAMRQISAPAVFADLPGYESPATGRWIEGKRARREDLLASDCVEYDPSMRAENARRRKAEEDKFEKAVEATLDSEIQALPARKKEKLAEEISAGAGADYVRSTGEIA